MFFLQQEHQVVAQHSAFSSEQFKAEELQMCMIALNGHIWKSPMNLVIKIYLIKDIINALLEVFVKGTFNISFKLYCLELFVLFKINAD